MLFVLMLLLLMSTRISSHAIIEYWSNVLIKSLMSDLDPQQIVLINCVKEVKINTYSIILKQII